MRRRPCAPGDPQGPLTAIGRRFRNQVVEGPGGKQIQLLDPDENPIELFEPASRS